MPALDRCQPEVIRALEKQGWTTNGKAKRIYIVPSMLIVMDFEAFKDGAQIFVETKCFPQANRSQELHIAFGQYLIYREVLTLMSPTSVLYLAVPHNNADLTLPVIRATIRNNHVKLIAIDLQHEEVIQWIE